LGNGETIFPYLLLFQADDKKDKIMSNAIQLRFLGCGDAFGSGGRLNTCFYVNAPSSNFLIDCGASSLIAMQDHGLTSDHIDTILITHFHGDHYGGLPFLLLDAAKQRKRKEPLTIVTPETGQKRIRQLMELLYPGTSSVMDELDLRLKTYKAYQTVATDALKVTGFPVIHSKEAYSHGLRIEVDDRVIGFSGDTCWTDELKSIAESADLLVCECNFFNTVMPNHVDYRTLEEKLPQLSARKIILNHLGDEMLANIDHVELSCADDGMTINM